MEANQFYRKATAFFMAVPAAALLATVPAAAQGTCPGAELVTPGKLTVAYNGDMPGTGTKDGKLIGIDGEIMNRVAEKLGLQVEPALMEWSAEIESVKARRVDVMHGMMGWTQPRTQVIVMTDPIYFAGSLLTQRKGSGITKLEQLKTKRVATLQGYAQVPEIKTFNPDVKLYETSDAAIRDLVAGRIDVLFSDPPMMQYMSMQRTDLNIESIPVTDAFDAKRPILTGKFQVVYGMSKSAPKLEKCVNDAIAEVWKSCANYKIAASYGLSDRFWFTPPDESPRRGVDRAQDWKYPELASCTP